MRPSYLYLLEEQQASNRYSRLLNDLYLTDEGACGHALEVYCVSRRLPPEASDLCGTKCLIVSLAQILLITVSGTWNPNICVYVNMQWRIIPKSVICVRGALSVRGPSYLGLIRSIPWLLMSWLLTSPGLRCRCCY